MLMKRMCSGAMALVIFFLLFSTFGSVVEAAPKTYYSYADIVRRTYDMKYLATVPKTGEGGFQITSTDPASKYNEETDTYEEWSANRDDSGYVRYNEENGYRVLADLKGPGYLTRLWGTASWMGNLHIWIDGELVVDMPEAKFVAGSAFEEIPELSFKANYFHDDPYGTKYLGGIDLFVPITYNESCLVEIELSEQNPAYYIVGYYNLEEGASVEPFTWPMSDTNWKALKQANEILADETVPVGKEKFSKSLAPGEEVTVFSANSAGALTSFSMDLNIPKEEVNFQTSLTEWEIKIYWDNSETPAVSMSVGDFFGTPYGLYDHGFDSAGYGVTDDGIMYSTWYMPYNSAKVVLANNSSVARTIECSFASESLTDAEVNIMTRFHANWQRTVPYGGDRYPDVKMLYVEGEGRYVGTSLHVFQSVDDIWWGEGDAKFYIDGEKFPSWYDTGSEDYFGYAHCGGMLFNYPYCGQTYNDGTRSTAQRQLQGNGDKVNYRTHITDNICFHSSLEANIEKYFVDSMVKYAATTYFYLTKETSNGHVPVYTTQTDRLFNNRSTRTTTTTTMNTTSSSSEESRGGDENNLIVIISAGVALLVVSCVIAVIVTKKEKSKAPDTELETDEQS